MDEIHLFMHAACPCTELVYVLYVATLMQSIANNLSACYNELYNIIIAICTGKQRYRRVHVHHDDI